MASQPGPGSEERPVSCCEIRSFVRGVHAYKEKWHPRPGQVLALRREPCNSHDEHAVAVVKPDGTVVGHIPYNIAPVISSFIARDYNKGTVEITGERVNRGAGYGLEAPCIYRLYGPKKYLERLEDMVARLRDRSLVPES